MVINTVNQLVELLNQVDTDATVLSNIINDDPLEQANGPLAGVVTTRLGANVKNIQKVIADAEDTIAAAALASINAQTGTSYSLTLDDRNAIVTMDNASANTLTIEPTSTTAYPAGYTVEVIQLGAGTTTITAGAGVTLNGVTAGSGDLSAQYSVVKLRHVAADVWIIDGAIGAIA